MPEAGLSPALRRIAVIEAHRRRTGRCPRLLHSLGTGESFAVEPAEGGFLEVSSGLLARADEGGVEVPGARIEVEMEGDVLFSGREARSAARFTGRAGGGSSVTLYEPGGDYFQFAVVE